MRNERKKVIHSIKFFNDSNTSLLVFPKVFKAFTFVRSNSAADERVLSRCDFTQQLTGFMADSCRLEAMM